MLKFIFVSIFSALSLSAQACDMLEAQVVASVVASSVSEAEDCQVSAKLSWVHDHVFCPIGVISVGDTVSFSVEKSVDGTCPAAGSEISGVLKLLNRKYSLEN